MSDSKFINGLIAKEPNPKVAQFVKCNLSIKREELIQTLQGMTGEWVNVDVKVSAKSGKWYCQINEWKKEDNKGFTPPTPQNDQDNASAYSEIGFEEVPF